jgi:soluble cytochrome b562
MQISSITGGALSALQGNDRFAKIKQSFENLGSALESGNLSDAKTALADLQKNAPKKARDSSNPMSQKMDALSKAIDSGDVKAAQAAYADIKQTTSQRPAGRPSGAPPGGAGKTSGTEGSSSSNKTYDKMDANKDGIVSWKEEQDYAQKHPDYAKTNSATTKINSDRGLIDALA